MPSREITEADYSVDARGCWVWSHGKMQQGYGETFHQGKVYYAHRLAYEQHKGPIPSGLQIDHLCRNRACCNPEHLEAVTPAVNSRRGKMTRLTMAKAREIRSLIVLGLEYEEIAAYMAVSDSAVWSVVVNRSWREDGTERVPAGRGSIRRRNYRSATRR